MIIRYGGFTILTDPNFLHAGDHVHLGYGLRSQRRTNPAIEVEELPPIDFVLLSHLHGDHFDRIAEEKLDRTVPIITTLHAARYLEGKAFRPPVALNTWDAVIVYKGDARVRVGAMPGTHAPGPFRKVLPPVMESMLKFGDAEEEGLRLRMYITGDTLVYDRLKEIPERYTKIDLAFLHLGDTSPWPSGYDGRQARRRGDEDHQPPHRRADPLQRLHRLQVTLDDFKEAILEAGLEDRVRYLVHGETYEFEVPENRRR